MQITVKCPKCAHEQSEPVGAISTACVKCYTYIAMEEAVAVRSTEGPKRSRVVVCPFCASAQKVYPQALTITCVDCGSNVNISNHKVTGECRHSLTTFGEITFEKACRYLGPEVCAQVIHASGELQTRLKAFSELHIRHRTVISGPISTEQLFVHPGAKVYARRMTAASFEVSGYVAADVVMISGPLTIRPGGFLSAKIIKAGGLDVQANSGIEGYFETISIP